MEFNYVEIFPLYSIILTLKGNIIRINYVGNYVFGSKDELIPFKIGRQVVYSLH